jgi:predicted DsbA family dithiol-disulfide isomerase
MLLHLVWCECRPVTTFAWKRLYQLARFVGLDFLQLMWRFPEAADTSDKAVVAGLARFVGLDFLQLIWRFPEAVDTPDKAVVAGLARFVGLDLHRTVWASASLLQSKLANAGSSARRCAFELARFVGLTERL